MKPISIFLILFLILIFISGIYFCATHKLPMIYEGYENYEEGYENKGESDSQESNSCPDLLIKSGNTILLYNSKMPEKLGINPLPFYNLDEYINYLEIQRKRGIHCPVLFLQEENNTQGKSVYRIRPDIFNPQAGLPTTAPPNATTPALPETPKLTAQQVMDANRAHPPYNSGNYPGFDPTGLYIGIYTTIDQVHDLTKQSKPLSENPMDDNWAEFFTQKRRLISVNIKKMKLRHHPLIDLLKK
jgi:hypothetical protein